MLEHARIATFVAFSVVAVPLVVDVVATDVVLVEEVVFVWSIARLRMRLSVLVTVVLLCATCTVCTRDVKALLKVIKSA